MLNACATRKMGEAPSCTVTPVMCFLHGSSYGAMFWICDENSGDDAGLF